MIDVMLAEQFIEKMSDWTAYNINIMNEKGIIIASRDKSRIGTFHEVAYQMLQNGEGCKEVGTEKGYLGVKRGVNMTIDYKNQAVGVIGLTGDTKEIREVALVIKKSVETMLEYEVQRAKVLKRYTTKERFRNCLLYEEADRKELDMLSKSLGYVEAMRIPITISVDGDISQALKDELIRKIKMGDNYCSQDIILTGRYGRIIIFKYYDDTFEEFFGKYKFMVGEFLQYFMRYALEQGIQFKIYIGSVQDSLTNYKFGFQNCLWLEKHITSAKKHIFFYDHLDEYFKFQLPSIELHKVFAIFSEQYSEEFKTSYQEHIGALYQNNYNMQESSASLFIHKNTLSFRLDKIKNQMGLNPMQNTREREIVNYFYYYLHKQN